MSQEAVLKRQNEIGTKLNNICSKFSDGQVRKTQVAENERIVEELWLEFKSNHERLDSSQSETSNYVINNFFSQVHGVVLKIRQMLMEGLKAEVVKITQTTNTKKYLNDEEAAESEAVINFRENIIFFEERFEERMKKEDSEFPEILEEELKDLFNDLKIEYSSELKNDKESREEFDRVRKRYFDALRLLRAKQSNTKQQEVPVSKLQEIRIPYFEGGSGEWASFFDLFNTLVNKNERFSKAEKMQRLKSLVRGEAAKLISHFYCTEDSYDDALEELKNRYENERVMFANLVDRLLDQPNLNSEKAASIRQLLDTTNTCVRSIKKMEVDVEGAKSFIARIIIRKFDSEAVKQYEYSVKKTRKIQTLEDVLKFLEQMSQAQESFKAKKYSTNHNKPALKQSSGFATESTSTCVYCKNKGHRIQDCRKFMQLNVPDRRTWVNKTKSCLICLYHQADKRCYRPVKCNKCGKDHNTLLHLEYPNNPTTTEARSGSFVAKKEKGKSLLATALVRVKSLYGELITMRALIDQGSQETSISEEAVQILQLPRKKAPKTELIGYGDTVVGISRATVDLEIRPRIISNEVFKTQAMVLSSLVGFQPATSFNYDISKWDNCCLADPNFNKSDRIDIVIGSDVFHSLIEDGMGTRKIDTMLGQDTKLGWVLSGMLKKPEESRRRYAAVTTNLERFWETEEIPEVNLTPSKDECIKFFEETTTVTEDNRLVVRLPFEKDHELGNSRKQAMARNLSREKTWAKNPTQKQQYIEFMRDYIKRGHMIEVPANSGKCYLPHQGVYREDSITTKVRVVFDASAKTTNNRSLNDVLIVGPKLQKYIFDMVINFRLWSNVVTADVEKMYRQILVCQEDQAYQHILWREEEHQPMREFKLTTVTYGTSSAPFLAKKALAHIAVNCENNMIKNIILNDFYMDDLMTGADSEEECKYIQKEVSLQLSKFGFPLRKWMSNNKKILEAIPDEGNIDVVSINDDESIKTLGLQWHPKKDVFKFVLKLNNEKIVTKRNALSTLARMFDPLGWLSPFTTLVKLFIQKLWLMKIDWDEELDEELQTEWEAIVKGLPCLQGVIIPRWYTTTQSTKAEIHGFADASQKAYAGVVYIKVGSTINLVAAKSKVNSIKNRKTLPKLELCAAHLLARLIERIISTMQRQFEVNAWSDSTITLAWISNNKSKDRFIRSRVDEINKLLPTAVWRHVDTKNNPADAASRGVTADKISSLWWCGPSWLKNDKSGYTSHTNKTISLATNSKRRECWLETISTRCSTYTKLERVIAYVRRFVGKLRRQKYPDWLTSDELQQSQDVIMRQHQAEKFFPEIQNLLQKKEVDQKSKIASLHPFLDKNGILRVGGRLGNSELPYNHKHPIILEKSWLAEVIVNNVHVSTLHGGNNLVASIVHREYWIIGLKMMIKKVIRYCVRCIRYRKANAQQIMGNLPLVRVAVSHPFTHTGVDYAGPISMKCSRGRGQKTFKGYIAVFVCMSTKALHLEPVSDLTTDAFLAALRRFFSRRGKSRCIYSDNGTNFVGAARKLEKEFVEAVKQNSTVWKMLEAEKIEWHFIPPASPHFGGIWESGVKSMKYHLRRVIGDSLLTYEEMATLLAQIEAVLNSRPIHTINNSIDGVDVLTPGHFLIGQPLIGSPEIIDEKGIGSLDRWKIVQKMKRDFWQRWKDEYLITLQHRYKWRNEKQNLETGDVVIIKDEQTAPGRWPLARIIENHQGKDGKVRVVTLQTQSGVLKRPIHKLCPLQSFKDDKVEVATKRGSYFTKSTTSQKTKITLLTLWVIMMLANSVQSVQVTKVGAMVRKFGNNTILYVDKIGTMSRQTSSWSLVSYYDMEPYFMTVVQIDKSLRRCREVCQKLRTFEEQCSVVLDSMEDRLNVIKENDILFSHQDKERTKRSPFDFVGSFYHVLFGMMDANDREMIQENMRKVIENEHNIKHLVEKQTSVVESTVNILKKTTNEVKLQFDVINEKVRNISETINTDYFVYKESINFFMMSRQLEVLVDDAEKIQIQIIGLLMDINHGKINPNLIHPKKMHEEMLKIKENLSAKMRLPGKSKENVLQTVYRLMTARGVFVDGKLVINIKIPLLERQPSDIFRILPLPIMKDGRKMQVILRQQFVVYNYEADAYHLASQPMLNQCQKDGDDEYMCQGNWAWEDANDHSCELASLKPSNPYSCTYTEIYSRNIWLELHARSNWLFRIFEDSTAHIVCAKNNQKKIIQLPMQGILTLSAGCTARIGRTTLTSLQDVKTEEFNNFQTYLFKDVKDVELIKPLNNSMLNHTEEIDALIKEINAIKSENIELKSLNWHHASGHSSLTLICIFVIVFVIFLVRRYRKKNNKKVEIMFNLPRQNVQDRT